MKSAAPADFATDAARWAAVQARDPAADDSFVYAVRTTGVYCRPSSSARLPRRDNVEFFDTAQAAEAAGYRASRRAAADRSAAASRRAALVVEACRLIEEAETPPRLEALARHAGVSPFHLHRVFRAETGLTPKDYASARRGERLRGELGNASGPRGTITEAIHGAGFNSGSRFYEASDRVLGMRPRDYREGGRDARIVFALGQCSLGAILVARSERGICSILLGDDPDALLRDLQDQFPRARLIGGDA
ncbi:MAG TPA: Ada metal-binding domain-containing protein, partial [Burkholderiaceae bacterium]|nr:Ada metal-binding domain-containing protein [Burkholderiaceae bacterium]